MDPEYVKMAYTSSTNVVVPVKKPASPFSEAAVGEIKLMKSWANKKLSDIAFGLTYTLSINGSNDLLRKAFNNSSTGVLNALKTMTLAGGCFASYLQGSNPNDFDLFIDASNPNYLNMLNLMIEIGKKVESYKKVGDFDVYEVDLNVDRNKAKLAYDIKDKVQVIFLKSMDTSSVRNSADLWVKSFPFEHTKISLKEDKLQITPLSFYAAKTMALVFDLSKKAPATRYMEKFLNRGYETVNYFSAQAKSIEYSANYTIPKPMEIEEIMEQVLTNTYAASDYVDNNIPNKTSVLKSLIMDNAI